MDTQHLREFVILAELLNFSRAAECLHISQPLLSRHLQALEREVGVDLMQRTRSSVSLTPAGEIFAPAARSIIKTLDERLLAVRATSEAASTFLNVGFISALTHAVTQAAMLFCQKQSKTEVKFYELGPAELIAALRDGRLDIAIIGQAVAAHEREFDLFDVMRVPLLAVLPASHLLAKEDCIDLKALANERFTSLPDDEYPGRDAYVRKHCKAAGFEPRFRVAVQGVGAALSAVAQGGCVSVFPEAVRTLPHTGVAFVKLKQKSAFVTAQAAVRRGERRKAVHSYLVCMREVAAMARREA